jgi:hypothetical protein
MKNLSDNISRKFTETFDVSEWQVETDDGYANIVSSNKTIEYEVYRIELENGLFLECADDHILITSGGEEVFAKDSVGIELITKIGSSKVVSVESLGSYEPMYDLSVDSENHTYFTNDILSHNTTTSAAYILWYTLFQSSKTVAILANKAAAAREVLHRYQLMYEHLPKWLQQGVTTWNKGDIELENGCIVFTAATSASGIRGKSCVTGDTKVCIEQNDMIFYTEIETIINNSRFIEVNKMRYYIYKTTNTLNSKIYIGFHSSPDEVRLSLDFGSCFTDGYLGSGKLLKRAIEKYTPSVFKQEIIGSFDKKEDAEALEKTLVNEEFVSRDDTYNISIGGNVTILYGSDNGFFGKTHSSEAIQKIQNTRTENKLPTYQVSFTAVASGEIYRGYSQVLNAFEYSTKPRFTDSESINRRLFIANLLKNNIIKTDDESIIDGLFQLLDQRAFAQSIERKQEISLKRATECAERFTGITKSEEQRSALSASNKLWIENNREDFRKRMSLINSNPEKIRKTAEKHRGMKRSTETKQKLSLALSGITPSNKGKIAAHDPITGEFSYFEKDNVPTNWILGLIKKSGPKNGVKCYTNGIDYKMFTPGDEPNDWVLGARKKNK